MPQHLHLRFGKFRAFCHADLHRRRCVRKDTLAGHRPADDLHQAVFCGILIPQAVRPRRLCFLQNRAVKQRGHNNNFYLRTLGFDLTDGNQSVFPVLRLHIHQNEIDRACSAHLNCLLRAGNGCDDLIPVLRKEIAFQQAADHGLVFNDHHSHALFPPFPAD